MAYADVQDLENRWRYLTPEEQGRAAVLLEDASAIIEQYETDDSDLHLFKIVACNMVKRAMETAGDAFGVDGQIVPSMGWGSSLPVGTLEPYKSEIRMLRGNATKIGFVPMTSL